MTRFSSNMVHIFLGWMDRPEFRHAQPEVQAICHYILKTIIRKKQESVIITIKEFMRELGIQSTAMVWWALRKAKTHGFISIEKKGVRTVYLARSGYDIPIDGNFPHDPREEDPDKHLHTIDERD